MSPATALAGFPAGVLAGVGGGMVAAAPLGLAAACVRSVMMVSPWDTRSPTLIRMAPTVPAARDGISIVALSDSSVITGSSALISPPSLTRISMTGTSLKSPLSGMRLSIPPMGRSPVFGGGYRRSQDQPADILQHVAEMPGEARRERSVDHPMVVG